MAFGGFFGGSGKDSSSSSSSSSDSAQSPSIQNPLSTSFPSSSSQTATLSRIQSAISEQSNVGNAKQLISNVNTNCFEKCVPSPGSALTGGEQKCLTACMEKYIDAWNVTSRTYTARLQREMPGMAAGLGSGGQGGGKELF